MVDCERGMKMWPSFRGDSMEMYLKFTKQNGKPIDVQGKMLHFTMRLDRKDPICHVYDIYYKTRIPFDTNAKNGKVHIVVPAELSNTLLPEREYWYDFQLTDDDCDTFSEVATTGWGTKEIMRDVTVLECDTQDRYAACE